ncbi:carbon-nitrogen hydrolase family protein [Caldinitratiruptor microaerophilus]|uniref:Nitrilase n=1 Tax=Caldinitratiruptor microaerophilus TaxID=671077 RepID=A0AA35CP15_9FIRM|nr:carbon-nitrogen hydrolase family protein [Caldinitratiruptor microaerophilus]BDG62139.1 nitrilase [Caldinitratiruptor microaerophilus]
MGTSVRVAVVQAAPVLLDREATVGKTVRLIEEAAGQGTRLIVFPEAFIPAYPRGLTFGTVVGSRSEAGRRAFARYWDNAVDVPGPATEAIGAAARRTGAYVAVGVIERAGPYRGSTLYCTLLYFGPDGSLLGKHRKLKPTGAERLIWGEGDGSTLTAIRTEFGTVGGLICWENYMPLARMAMYGKGVEIYLAPTADCRDTWQATIQHIACEGRCFVLSCNQFVTRQIMPADWEDLGPGPEVLCRGGSAILGPLGQYLAGPLYDREGILTADLDLDQITQARYDFDVIGHYNRPDVFRLIVNESPAVGFESVPRPEVVHEEEA